MLTIHFFCDLCKGEVKLPSNSFRRVEDVPFHVLRNFAGENVCQLCSAEIIGTVIHLKNK